MSVVFLDTYYYLAFVNEQDAGHGRAVAFAESYQGRAVTTEWVLTELADALSGPSQRSVFLQLLRIVASDPMVLVVESTHDLFERGTALFAARLDKSWSLTDCISFVVMQDRGIANAATADRHFVQAGFTTLLT